MNDAHIRLSGATVPRAALEVTPSGGVHLTLTGVTLAAHWYADDPVLVPLAQAILTAAGWGLTPPPAQTPCPHGSTVGSCGWCQASIGERARVADEHVCGPGCPDAAPDLPRRDTTAAVEEVAAGRQPGEWLPEWPEDAPVGAQAATDAPRAPSIPPAPGQPTGILDAPGGQRQASPSPPGTHLHPLMVGPTCAALSAAPWPRQDTPAVPMAQRFTPCGNRPCQALGSHHDAVTGRCLLPGCQCMRYTADVAFLTREVEK